MGSDHRTTQGMMDRDDHLLQFLSYDVPHILLNRAVNLQCDDAFVVRQWDHVRSPCLFQYAFRYFPCEVFVKRCYYLLKITH